VYTLGDHDEYLAKLGADYWSDLEVGPKLSTPVDYGSRL
jgi:glutaconate CoA-transferase subunit A